MSNGPSIDGPVTDTDDKVAAWVVAALAQRTTAAARRRVFGKGIFITPLLMI
jgi:hypothetical protein